MECAARAAGRTLVRLAGIALAAGTAAAICAAEPTGVPDDGIQAPAKDRPDWIRTDLLRHLSAHDASYLAYDQGAGPRGENAQFQFSLAIPLIIMPGQAELAGAHPVHGTPVSGFYAAYTQTTYWDLEQTSFPIVASDYRPELAWRQLLPADWLLADRAALDAGFWHESNGEAGLDSRQFDALCIRPQLEWDLTEAWRLRVAPRFFIPLGQLSENPDITEYRGRADLFAQVEHASGLAASTRLRLSDNTERASIQLSVSAPLEQLWSGINVRLFAQGFAGWSEYLSAYDTEQIGLHVVVGFAISH